jgi:anaerobic magnesium-protoporphyrin IX monomethyl ester cyclase
MESQTTSRASGGSNAPLFSCHPLRPKLTHGPGESLLKSASGARRREAGERPRVLLMVPPYTRLVEPVPRGSAYERLGIDTFEVMKRAGTPIGLLRIGTAAKLAGYDVRIIDAPFAGWQQESRYLSLPEGQLLRYGLTDEQIRRAVEEFRPDVVGIQCNYTVQWGNARALADLVKSIDPGIVVVSGGAHSSGDWANALLDSPIDVIVINEADRSFVTLLDALTTRATPTRAVRGISYREGGELVHADLKLCGSDKSSYLSLNPRRQSLDERKSILPLPDFGFLSMDMYDLPFHSSGARVRKSGAWAQIFSTIGCNVGCDFCYIPMVNGPWRALGIDWFDQHLGDIKRHGVSEVLIEDDHLMHDPLYAMEVCRLLKKHDLPWVEEGGLSLFNLILLNEGESFLRTMTPEEQRHPNFRNVVRAMQSGLTAKEMIKTMAESGCYNVYLAVESANEESLENSNKPKINSIQKATMDIVSMFAEHNIQVTGGFMLGFVNPPERAGEAPYIESLEQIERTIDYAVKLMGAGMAYANPFIVTPIPGTPMWQFQKQYVVRNYDTGWSHEKATLATSSWSAEDIERMRLKLLVDANGPERVKKMVQRGTWPVDA